MTEVWLIRGQIPSPSWDPSQIASQTKSSESSAKAGAGLLLVVLKARLGTRKVVPACSA